MISKTSSLSSYQLAEKNKDLPALGITLGHLFAHGMGHGMAGE
jgi:hypothetical protein